MQHTDKYQFNLIDADDTFSPGALNENAQKLEDALVTHEAVVDTALKAQKLEWQVADSALSGQLSAEKTRVDGRLSALDTAKAEQTALTAETAARESALAALAGRVGALESGQLLWKYGTYTGTGISGPDHPTRLEFDFKPILVFIGHPTDGRISAFWLRGMSQGLSCVSSNAIVTADVSWEDRAVLFYSSYPGYQFNDTKNTYCYFALGTKD